MDGSLLFFLHHEDDLEAHPNADGPEFARVLDVTFESDVVKRLFEEFEHIDELCELVDELWPAPDRGSVLRIGGYCVEVGGRDAPWTLMASTNLKDRYGVDPDLPRSERVRLRKAEEHRLIREWVPLAQFHTESDFHYGCFLTSSDDLAAHGGEVGLSRPTVPGPGGAGRTPPARSCRRTPRPSWSRRWPAPRATATT